MANPYDFTSGFVGAMEARAKRDAVDDAIAARADRRAEMQSKGLISADKKKKSIFENFFQSIKDMGKNVSQGSPSFSTVNTPDGNRMETGGAATNIEAPTAPEVPVSGLSDVGQTVADAGSSIAEGITDVVAEAADGTYVQNGQPQPRGIQAPGDQQEPPPSNLSDDDRADALRSRSPFLALYKEDPKAAESLYDQVSDFKKLSNTLTTMSAYDFIDGKGSDGLRQNVAYLRALQKEGVFEAAIKASHGDMVGAKKAFLNYGDVRDPNFEIVPREVMEDDKGIKGGKTKYKVFDVKFPDGSSYTLDTQKLALEALSAKEYLERGDKEFEKGYKRESLNLQERELGIRAEANRNSAADRADRKEDSNFNRGIQLGNATFESITRTEIAPLESKFEKEVAPFKDIATTNPAMYEQKIAPIRAQYDAEIGRRKMAFEAARQRYLIGLQKGERIDPYTIYSNAYRMLGNQ